MQTQHRKALDLHPEPTHCEETECQWLSPSTISIIKYQFKESYNTYSHKLVGKNSTVTALQKGKKMLLASNSDIFKKKKKMSLLSLILGNQLGLYLQFIWFSNFIGRRFVKVNKVCWLEFVCHGVVCLSICWLCPRFPLFIHPFSHLSLSPVCNQRLELWKGACEMPVIHYSDSSWAMGLSCSGAPAEAQFPFVLWCIDPFRPPPECTPLVFTLLKPACAMDLPLMLTLTQQQETESAQNPKD